MIHVIIFVILKAIMDSISHHNSFKKLGLNKFFWKETAEAPKSTFLHKYFPMFYDMWHLATALQILQISWLVTHSLPLSLVFYTIGSLVFI